MARPRSFDEAVVIAKARDQFWKHGYTATSVQDLERATGLKRSSLYQAFGDKRALYDRTLATYRGDSQAYLRDLVASAESFSEAVRRMFAEAVDRLCNCPDRKGCFISNATTEMASTDPTIRLFVAANRTQFIQILLPLAVQCKQELSLKPKTACDYVFTLYSGLSLLAKSGATKADLEAVVASGRLVFAKA